MKLINVTHIFIDEISMVGSTLAEYANIRLQEIFDCKKPFGGKHVIAIGDFYQMKPVMDDTYLETVANVILHSPQMYSATILKYIHLQKSCVKKKKRIFVKY